ncbi:MULTISPECIES: MFS transporter [Kitasatospora]|uniref:Putative drug resistance protein n=1 Tax=Kitasatospora setae (strain ATCC 33774 / DSM 43861 / JCM 3304 / KCC A-0304 / NBRC 14216 / KM-6054) TaxID=452652 RepID=E4NBU6_KITSK|nr:MFS transporter [Kitasatospora setae]BAJ28677.1 putative drug resistance protein [Kitasatospora setae KM-6054]
MTSTSQAETAAPAPLPLPDDDGTAGVLSGPWRALTLGIVSVVLLLAFEATAVNTAMPTAAQQLDGISLYAFAFSGYFTTTLLAMVVSGQWCDRRGPLVPLFSGIAVFAAGLVTAGTAVNMWMFVAGRAVQGLGGGLVIVALYVVVGRAFPERLRPAVFAAFSAAWVLPSILGPVISGAVTQHLGWRWVFLAVPVLVLLPLAVMGPALRRAERSQPPLQAGPYDWRRTRDAAMVAVGAALLQYAGQRLDVWAPLPAAAGLALLGPAVLRLLPTGTLRAARGLPTVILLRAIAAGAFFASELFIPLMMQTQRGLSVTMAGLTLAPGGLAWAFGSWLQGRPGADRHRAALIRIGFLSTAIAVGGAALVLFPAVPVWVTAVFWGVGGAGMGMAIASISVLMMKLSKPEETGENSAALQLGDALGNVLLTGLAGVLFAALGGGAVGAAADGGPLPAGAFAAVFLTMPVVALVGAALSGRATARAGA